jgi:hypothetical protein
MHLSVYDYTNNQDNVRFVPVETKKGYKAEVVVEKSKRATEGMTVLMRTSDPERDYPHLSSDLARILGRTHYVVLQLAKQLAIKGNRDYHTSIKTGVRSSTQKYSDKTLSYMREYLEKNPQWSPYKKAVTRT